MDEQNRNLLLATVLSFFVIVVWYVGGAWLFPEVFAPEPAPLTAVEAAPAVATAEAAAPTASEGAAAPDTSSAIDALAAAPRLIVETPKLNGSISMLGARIDDLSLITYRETLDPNSPEVRLLSPIGAATPYYALFGWAPGAGITAADVPGAKTLWTAPAGAVLTPQTPVTLTWSNTSGLNFARTISVDDDFMFTVADKVQNTGMASVALYPYGLIARHGLPKLTGIYVVHEGAIRRTDGTYQELDYGDLKGFSVVESEGYPAEVTEAMADGWIGFTDHYWMTTLVPAQGKPWTAVTKYVPGSDIYQAEIRQPVQTVAPGATIEVANQIFVGAKEWATIRDYQSNGIAGFIDSIDWGWFFFLTKPIFSVLHWLNAAIGNMGLAIIGLTFFLKILVLPLAYKSYVSMARMKELQPEMEALKERCGADKQKMQKETMQLYKDKKVNPAAGCLPILIQIPIFFSLYKVIFVTLELRHAPFFGWLTDLSAPDSSSLYNLFGLLPWAAPIGGSLTHTIFIGVLPIILGISMWAQQKLNPAPTDPVQQQIFAWMPWVFMFMLGSFASGLVVYWITNNTITFAQQYMIMRSHGHKPDIFGNIASGFKKDKKPVAAANSPKAPEKSKKK
jgi:YidC/Oxa1 family membrane protein insertase